MKVVFGLCLTVVCWLGVLNLNAGDMYPITLQGTVYQQTGSGQIGGTPITQDSLLQSVADRAGVSPSGMLIVYHVGGNGMGDTIDVINRQNGQVLDNLFGFYFGENFGARRALYSASGNDQRRLDYVYTHQNSVAMGSAVIAKRMASASRLVVNGNMQWIITPENGDNSKICSAKFSTGPKLNF